MEDKSATALIAKQMADSHEKRLDKMEDNYNENSTQLAVVVEKLSNIQSLLEDNNIKTNERIDKLSDNINKLSEKMDENDNRVIRLETKYKSFFSKYSNIKKVIYAVLIAAAGLLGKDVGLWLFHKLKS